MDEQRQNARSGHPNESLPHYSGRIARALRADTLQPTLSPTADANPATARVAMVLNRNARRANDALARRIERLLGADCFFYSRNLDEAESFCRHVVQQGVGTVICGGGDGTLVRAYNLIHSFLGKANAWRAERAHRYGDSLPPLVAPRLAFIPLGTGNALRSLVGAADPFDDIAAVVSGTVPHSLQLPTIECEDESYIFGGIGYDAMLLSDYQRLTQHRYSLLSALGLRNIAGYMAAILLRSLPRVLWRRPVISGRIIAPSGGFYIDPKRGDCQVPLPAGTVLHEGPLTMVAVSTSPYLGYGFKMFPFAGLSNGMMQLRIGTAGASEVLRNLPAIWKGHYRSPGRILDYLVPEVKVQLDSPFAYQHSGDSCGDRSTLHCRIGAHPLQLVDFYRRAHNRPA